MIHAKLLSFAVAVALSLATPAEDLGRSDEGIDARRSLFVLTATCIAGGEKSAEECCADAKGDDPICTLLGCVNLEEVKLKDQCNCGAVQTACKAVAPMAGLLEGFDIGGLCSEVDECCDDGAADNEKFNECLGKSAEDGSFEVPDLSAIFPDGVPTFEFGPGPQLVEGGLGNATLGGLGDSLGALTNASVPVTPPADLGGLGDALDAIANATAPADPPANDADSSEPLDSEVDGIQSTDGGNDASNHSFGGVIAMAASLLTMVFV